MQLGFWYCRFHPCHGWTTKWANWAQAQPSGLEGPWARASILSFLLESESNNYKETQNNLKDAQNKHKET